MQYKWLFIRACFVFFSVPQNIELVAHKCLWFKAGSSNNYYPRPITQGPYTCVLLYIIMIVCSVQICGFPSCDYMYCISGRQPADEINSPYRGRIFFSRFAQWEKKTSSCCAVLPSCIFTNNLLILYGWPIHTDTVICIKLIKLACLRLWIIIFKMDHAFDASCHFAVRFCVPVHLCKSYNVCLQHQSTVQYCLTGVPRDSRSFRLFFCRSERLNIVTRRNSTCWDEGHSLIMKA